MKSIWIAVTVFMMSPIAGAAALDAWIGTFTGRTSNGQECRLSLNPSELKHAGEYDLSFSIINEYDGAVAGDWSLSDVRTALESKLDSGDSSMILHHDRELWGDANVSVTIDLDTSTMLPTSIHGELVGMWGIKKLVDCSSLTKER